MKSKEVFDTGMNAPFSLSAVLPALRGLNEGALDDVLNVNGCKYYQWSSALVGKLKPKQIVELGGAMGVWDLMVLNNLPPESKLYSITLPEHGLEYSFMADKYANFYPSLGDDLDLNNWPKDLDLKQTDLWFFDTEHNPEQLRKEFDLYSPFFKKGAIILVDDIHTFGLDPVWNEVKTHYDSMDATDPLHYSGFGICVV